MKRFFYAMTGLTTFCLVSPLSLADPKISGNLSAEQYSRGSSIEDPQLHFELENQQGLFDAQWLRSGLSLKIDGEVRDHSEESDLRFREVGLNVELGDSFSLFLGKKIIVWGKADQINPVDVINAENFETFLLFDQKRRKLARDLVQAQFDLFGLQLEWVAAPGQATHKLPKPEDPWCLGPCAELNTQTIDQFAATRGLDAFHWNHSNDTWEHGLRLSRSGEEIDFSLIYHRGINRFEVYDYQLYQNMIMTSNNIEHRTAYGFDAATTVDQFAFRTEVLFQKDRVANISPESPEFFSDGDGVVKVDEVDWIIGTDTQFSRLYVNLQYGERQAFTDFKLVNPLGEKFVIFNTRYDLFIDQLILGLSTTQHVTDHSMFYQPEVETFINDDLALKLKGHIFDGDKKSLFGAFRKNNGALLSLTQYF